MNTSMRQAARLIGVAAFALLLGACDKCGNFRPFTAFGLTIAACGEPAPPAR
jgi:hypothetical protein